MRWKPDEQDLWCSGWAATRRAIHGIGRHKVGCPLAVSPKAPLETCNCLSPRERLGKLRCTLGKIREDKEGAGAFGVVNQDWPEVYTGMSLLIHRAWYEMPERIWMLVQDAQYVQREIPAKVKAAEIGIKLDDYWTHLRMLKTFLRGYIASLPKEVDGFVPKWTPGKTFVRIFDPAQMTLEPPNVLQHKSQGDYVGKVLQVT